MSQESMAFLEDIFYTAKIREIARKSDHDVRFVRDLTGIEKRLLGSPPSLVFVDLTADSLDPIGLIRKIRSQPDWDATRIIAYASHSRAELMEEANRVGAHVVLPKSEFLGQLSELLQGAMA